MPLQSSGTGGEARRAVAIGAAAPNPSHEEQHPSFSISYDRSPVVVPLSAAASAA